MAMYSRTDGVVDWRSCLDPAAELSRSTASHCGMAVSAQVYREVGSRRGRPAARRRLRVLSRTLGGTAADAGCRRRRRRR